MLPGHREILSEEEFRLIRDQVHHHCGLFFDADSRLFLERRLLKRLDHLGLAGFRDYYRFIRYSSEREQELAELVDIITTNETYFFREMFQLRALTEEIIPEILARRHRQQESGPLRIWSAGCSTGEEPYTVAMLLLESGCCQGHRVEIIGTDISHRVLRQARRGVYGASAFRATEEHFRQRYFQPEGEGSRVNDRVKDLVTISHLNLLDDAHMALLGTMDVVLCRNVMIYFDREVRKRVADSLFRVIRAGGFLLLGHADSLMNITTSFALRHLVNDLVYQKPLSSGFAGGVPCEK